MRKEIPLAQRILDTAETVLRRHGPEKTNVVDIARILGMSHANIYRHFPSKKALLEAVAARWLHALTDPLEVITTDRTRPAAERLAAWFNHLRKTKRRKLVEEPELFQVHRNVIEVAREVVTEHVRTMHHQVERIIADGVATGEFAGTIDPPVAARAFLYASAAFHHPAMVVQKPPATEADARAVLQLLLAGLRAGTT
ncbi:MAG: TetR family transcriptional regulator [Chthoniobacter sp.]|nr:TetR family transcriptional regulator [Chthoniobacter sp.]